jgi:biotin carboxylase
VNRPVVIVNPLSSGIELAPAFKSRGISAIAVSLQSPSWNGYGATIQSSDFAEIIPNQSNLVEILRRYNPLAIIPGTGDSVPLAEHLTEVLTPQFSNDPQKSLHRLHKAYMQEALKEAGVPYLKTLNTASEHEVTIWLKENELVDSPLVIKPPMSGGSDNVFHISAKGDWNIAFNRVLAEPSKISGIMNETAVVQEQANGPEFAVGTVSTNGKHYLAHLIKYNKISSHDRNTVYDHVEFIPFNEDVHRELFTYTQKVLDALGVRFGAAHTEIMLTDKGPRLIELGARMCGGPVVRFAREASGSSQADKLVEIYTDGDVLNKKYEFKKSVVPVFLKSPSRAIISNIEALAETSKLPTLFNTYIWFKNGDLVPQTVDYLTSIGIVALAGDREHILIDYKKIRHLESQLVFQEV